jgi:uncharacterized membrane protein YebE (DUF533 family)
MADGPVDLEDQWFHEKEADEHNKRKIAGSLGTDDQAVVDHIHALGLDGEVVEVIHLLPLIQIAWADGSVSVRERAAIMEAVEAHGVAPHSPAALFVASLLESRPSDTLLDEILAILREILAARNLHPSSMLEACQEVAAASGGLLGLGNKVSGEEREAIKKVCRALGPAIDEKASAKLG